PALPGIGVFLLTRWSNQRAEASDDLEAPEPRALGPPRRRRPSRGRLEAPPRAKSGSATPGSAGGCAPSGDPHSAGVDLPVSRAPGERGRLRLWSGRAWREAQHAVPGLAGADELVLLPERPVDGLQRLGHAGRPVPAVPRRAAVVRGVRRACRVLEAWAPLAGAVADEQLPEDLRA